MAMAASRSEDWTLKEEEAIVADYFHMLKLELTGQTYNKAAHNRALQEILPRRNRGSIEFKHANISAVLLQANCMFIAGYKPRWNFNSRLVEVVERWLEEDREFDRLALAAAERSATAPGIAEEIEILVDAPKRKEPVVSEVKEPRRRVAVKRDYLERESRNRSLGAAGEQFVADYEARRLHKAGKKALANRIEHVSKSRGDGLGYDILSFETDGRERFVEVKTTAFGIETPFYVSRNEVRFSAECSHQFVLSRVHQFFSKAPRLFELHGALEDSVKLDPVSYLAHF